MSDPAKYRALFLSDLHLGSRKAHPERLVSFLRGVTADKIYLVGDIVDKGPLSPDLMDAFRAAAPEAIYLFGNHDFLGVLGDLKSVSHTFHTTARGKILLVCHGDQFDPLMDGWFIVFHAFQRNILNGFVRRRSIAATRVCATDQGAQGAVCGHLHDPMIIDSSKFLYINTGDWVSSCTAVVEHRDGRFELLHG